MKRNRIIAIAAAGALAAMMLSACGSSGGAADAGAQGGSSGAEAVSSAEAAEGAVDYSQYTMGIIQPGPEDYYQNLTDRLIACADYINMQNVTLLSEYDANTEITNAEDLISQQVDAIVTQPLTSASAQTISKMGNDAGIPVFIVNATVDEGEGVPAAVVGTSFYDMGHMDADWLVENLDSIGGSAKVLEFQGVLGQGVADEITRGFEDGIAGNENIELVYQQDCQWDRATAISATEDQITAGTEFNVIFVHNEDMCRGVVDTLAENGLTDSVTVITQNGSDTGFGMLEEGLIECTVSNSPSLVAGNAIIAIMQELEGTLEHGTEIMAPVYTITQDNYQDPDTVTWDESWGIKTVEDYLAGN